MYLAGSGKMKENVGKAPAEGWPSGDRQPTGCDSVTTA